MIIDPEIKNIIPPMSKDEYQRLESNIIEEGCRDPLVIWEGILLDGHNRYAICTKHKLPFKTVDIDLSSRNDALLWIAKNQLGRRNLTDAQRVQVALKLKPVIAEQARERQLAGLHWNTNVPENLPEHKIEARDEVGKLAGVSGKQVDKVETVINHGDDKTKEDMLAGTISIHQAYQQSKKKKKKSMPPVDKPKDIITIDDWNKLSPSEKQSLLSINKSNKSQFNEQDTGSIEWAQWSWNPVTGCYHDCDYCYARDIANRFFEHKFKPAFIPGRLAAPMNTKRKSNDIVAKNVFTVSMGDLFGKWVPGEWIAIILEVIKNNPNWNFLMLTKNPKRLLDFTFPDNAWVGTTIDKQSRVLSAEKVFRDVKSKIKWVSCEPMLEPLTFNEPSIFQWFVIGGASASSQTKQFYPPRIWIDNIEKQIRNSGGFIYEKPNLWERIKEYPKG